MNAAASLDIEIPRFARQVRAALDDLPADDIDDMLDGLEADLAEQAADRGEDLDLLVSVRPVWWVLRGVVIFVCLAVPFGLPLRPDGTPLSWLFIACLVVLSVQWGRGRWLPHARLRAVRTVVNVITAIVGVVLVISAPTVVPQWFASTASVDYIETWRTGLAVDGERVRNVFAYDAAGTPLTDVQLFDQDGRPLTTTGAHAEDEDWQWDQYYFGGGGPVPVTVPGRQPIWNVFPLRELSGADAVYGDDVAGPPVEDAEQPAFPYERVPALPSVEGATDAATPTPAPSDAATPTPTPAVAP